MSKYTNTKSKKFIIKNLVQYGFMHYMEFDYNLLSNVIYKMKRGNGKNKNTYNDCFIMGDTETSKSRTMYYEHIPYNYVCCWSIAIRTMHKNIVTLWGRKPSELTYCIRLIVDAMQGEETYIYFHNLPYDFMFLRKFLIDEFGEPTKQLNTNKHKVLFITFDLHNKKITFKDSLPLAQVSLEKWSDILGVEHKKAVGSWDYDVIRDYNYSYSDNEFLYIECDVLAGVECLDATCEMYGKDVASIAYTMTGFVRQGFQNVLKNYHNQALSMAPELEDYYKLTMVYHGGYVHANRYLVSSKISFLDGEYGEAYDFASSYIFAIIACKFPMGKFIKINKSFNKDNLDEFLRYKDSKAMFFRLSLRNFKLKDRFEPMPFISWAKSDSDYCFNIVEANIDNGRVLAGGMVSFYTNEVDLDIILHQYEFDDIFITDVHMTGKGYLPRPFTDYVYSLFIDKCKLKGVDDVAYARSKSMLNSCYGCMVQKNIQRDITENYDFFDFIEDEEATPFDLSEVSDAELYEKYINRRNFILPYQWGVWVTSHSSRNLVLGMFECIDDERDVKGLRTRVSNLLYGDTDSGFGRCWNKQKIDAYNEWCLKSMHDNNYDFAIVNGKTFGLGTMELDKVFNEFKTMGAKRYCYRDFKTGELKITVAGVPKKNGVKCLKNDIDNFVVGLVFDGKTTNKKQLSYHYVEKISIIDGIEVGDFINMELCDYVLDSTRAWSLEDFIEFTKYEEIYMNTELDGDY